MSMPTADDLPDPAPLLPPQAVADEPARAAAAERREGRSAVPQAGTAPGIEPHELSLLPSSDAQVTVTAVDYGRDRFLLEEVADIPEFLARHRPDWSAVRWINIDGLTNMEIIRAFAEKYELHPLAVEDMIHVGQRPKCDDYPGDDEHPGRLFIVAPWIERIDGKLCTEQVSFFLGRKTLVTFQERPSELTASILQRLKLRDSRLRNNDASFLLYNLLDAMVDRLFPALEEISRHLEDLEEEILHDPRRGLLRRIYRNKRELVQLRRIVWPMRELIHNLHREHHECLSETTRVYLRDVYDHVVQALDLIETYRDMIDSITETWMTMSANRLNDIMKTLTVISTIFVPLTFLAGVYGMNMPIPEMDKPWLYPIFWLVCLGTAGAMLLWFRRRGWF